MTLTPVYDDTISRPKGTIEIYPTLTEDTSGANPKRWRIGFTIETGTTERHVLGMQVPFSKTANRCEESISRDFTKFIDEFNDPVKSRHSRLREWGCLVAEMRPDPGDQWLYADQEFTLHELEEAFFIRACYTQFTLYPEVDVKIKIQTLTDSEMETIKGKISRYRSLGRK